ncbi:hypothetical protein TNCV_3244871 [Trichonephila clavipes]|nr:hypothetical protein TNCV_3244871 [Trichonephila clavipes]
MGRTVFSRASAQSWSTATGALLSSTIVRRRLLQHQLRVGAPLRWIPLLLYHREMSLTSLRSAIQSTQGLLATDHVILNHSQVTWTTPELAPPLLTTTPTGGRFSSRRI